MNQLVANVALSPMVELQMIEFAPSLVLPCDGRHLETTYQLGTADDPRPRGATSWLCHLAHHTGTIAWEWLMLQDGVVMLADPNAVASNLRFVSSSGEVSDELRRVVLLNVIVHSLQWQHRVLAEIRNLKGGASDLLPIHPMH